MNTTSNTSNITPDLEITQELEKFDSTLRATIVEINKVENDMGSKLNGIQLDIKRKEIDESA